MGGEGEFLRLSSFARPVRAVVIGANRGIGLALTSQLARSPDVETVVAAARHPGDSEQLSALIASPAGKVSGVSIDVTDEESVRAAVVVIGESLPGLDLVVNCAGLLYDGPELLPERRLAHVEPANLERLFRVHAIGPLLLAKHMQSLFRLQSRGASLEPFLLLEKHASRRRKPARAAR